MFTRTQVKATFRLTFTNIASKVSVAIFVCTGLAGRKGVALFLPAFLLLIACDPPSDNRLWLHNESQDTLYFCVSYNGSLPSWRAVNETSDYLLPGDAYNAQTGSGSRTPNILAESLDTSMVIFTFLKSDIDSNTWSEIGEKKLYGKSKYHLEEIEERDWHLPIPRDK